MSSTQGLRCAFSGDRYDESHGQVQRAGALGSVGTAGGGVHIPGPALAEPPVELAALETV